MEGEVEARRVRAKDLFCAHIGMAVVQLGYSVFQIVTKVALDDNTNKIVFSVYRNLIALLFLAPVAYFSEKRIRPVLGANLLVSLFFLGVTGIFGNQILFLFGLAYTNPTYAAAIQPSVPVFTFILSLLLGVEKLNLRRIDGQGKFGGILVCVSGAILMALFQGPAVLGHGTSDTAKDQAMLVSNFLDFKINKWSLGVLFLNGNCICMAAYLAVQAKLLARYPAPISITVYAHFFGCLLMVMTAIFMGNMPTEWNLKRTEFFAVLVAGIVASFINYGVTSLSIKILGPSLVALYNPLQFICSAVLSRIFLGTSVYLGSIVGSVLVVVGLYLVTWASFIGDRRRITNPHSVPAALSKPFISEKFPAGATAP